MLNVTHMMNNMNRIKNGQKPLPAPTPQPQRPVDCHPKSECDVCKDPQDTFTPSSSGALGMADPEKYPDFKPAPFPFIGGANPTLR